MQCIAPDFASNDAHHFLDRRWQDVVFSKAGHGLLRFQMETSPDGSANFTLLSFCGDWVSLCGFDLNDEVCEQQLWAWLAGRLTAVATEALEKRTKVSFECGDMEGLRCFNVDVVALDVERGEIGLVMTGISSFRDRQRELYEGKLRYRALADALPMPVWVLKPDKCVQYVNSFFDQFFGEAARNFGSSWRDFIHPDHYSAFMAGLDSALDSRKSFQMQLLGRRSDGVWRWLDVIATPRHTNTRQFLGLACSMRDITDQRELELAKEQLLDAERAARAEAETNIRIKDEFLAMISHELRTPLTTVVGWSELLLQRMDRNDRNYRGMNVIVTSTQSLHQLINDMLDLGGMMVGKLQLSMQPLEMCSEVRDAVQALEAQAGISGVRIKLSLPGQPCVVHADRVRLQQVMWNLLSNALKFTDQASDRCIHVALKVEKESCHLVIQDNGVGISREFLPHLFTRFRQADSTSTRRFGGLGLGLSIVQNIVELHGGQVAAESEGMGKGAVFTVSLPLMERVIEGNAGQVFVEERALPQAVGTDSNSLDGLRILVVDDQQPILDYLRMALERHGASVETTTSATEALHQLSSQDPLVWDLVISDIGMPVMDGYTLARTIREKLHLDSEQLPMIAVTALSRPSDCELALASGFQSVIPKPCNLTELLLAINQCCVAVSGGAESKG